MSMSSRISERFDRLIDGRGGIDGRLRDMNSHQQEQPQQQQVQQQQQQKQQQHQQQQVSHESKGGRHNGGVADKENRGSSVFIADKSNGKGGKSKEKVMSPGQRLREDRRVYMGERKSGL